MINFFIDESGSFVSAGQQGAWNVTACAAIPNPRMRTCMEILRRLKVKSGHKYTDEIKLRNISEQQYEWFLSALLKTDITLYCVATDSGTQTHDEIAAHRDAQANKVEEHKDKMIHAEGREAAANLANRVRALSPQLHLQLVCQVELIAEIIHQSILFYVQRASAQLNGFKWRIDEKAPGVNNFEDTFKAIVPPVLQAKSLEKSAIYVKKFDYSAMASYVYSKEDAPQYLRDTYGIDVDGEGQLNLSKLVWGDFQFVDSKDCAGIQIADLLASGLRRCLRGDFQQKLRIASLLGQLMVERVDDQFPMRLVRVGGQNGNPDDVSAEACQVFRRHQKQMLR